MTKTTNLKIASLTVAAILMTTMSFSLISEAEAAPKEGTSVETDVKVSVTDKQLVIIDLRDGSAIRLLNFFPDKIINVDVVGDRIIVEYEDPENPGRTIVRILDLATGDHLDEHTLDGKFLADIPGKAKLGE